MTDGLFCVVSSEFGRPQPDDREVKLDYQRHIFSSRTFSWTNNQVNLFKLQASFHAVTAINLNEERLNVAMERMLKGSEHHFGAV